LAIRLQRDEPWRLLPTRGRWWWGCWGRCPLRGKQHLLMVLPQVSCSCLYCSLQAPSARWVTHGSPPFNARLTLPHGQPKTTGAATDSKRDFRHQWLPQVSPRGRSKSETPGHGRLENTLTALPEQIPPAPANVNLIESGQLTCKASPTTR